MRLFLSLFLLSFLGFSLTAIVSALKIDDLKSSSRNALSNAAESDEDSNSVLSKKSLDHSEKSSVLSSDLVGDACSNCAACNSNVCSSCNSGYCLFTGSFLFGYVNNYCIANNQFSPALPSQCTVCGDINSVPACTACGSGYYTTSTNGCSSCSSAFGSSCTSCTSSGCLSCSGSNVVINGKCTTCSAQFGSGCTQCSSSGCTTCNSGYSVLSYLSTGNGFEGYCGCPVNCQTCNYAMVGGYLCMDGGCYNGYSNSRDGSCCQYGYLFQQKYNGRGTCIEN